MITESNSNKNTAVADDPIIRLQRAAGTVISAAAVKAKFLAEQEQDHIRRLAELVIEKQVSNVPMILCRLHFQQSFQTLTSHVFSLMCL